MCVCVRVPVRAYVCSFLLSSMQSVDNGDGDGDDDNDYSVTACGGG